MAGLNASRFQSPPPRWPLATSRESGKACLPPWYPPLGHAPSPLPVAIPGRAEAAHLLAVLTHCAGGGSELSSNLLSTSSAKAGICLFTLEFVHRPYLYLSYSRSDIEVKKKRFGGGRRKNKVHIVLCKVKTPI